MPLSKEQRDFFTRSRHETLTTEIKSTLDLSTPEGKSTLVRACQALFNRNGGCLLVGFDNEGRPLELELNQLNQFTPDHVQEIVTKYSSPPFEVELDFLDVESARYPVICVPSGVRIPTSVKKEIKSADGKQHLRIETVFVRTLHANGSVSSAPLSPKDFPDLLDICFTNREIDLASFVRRHLHDLVAIQQPSSVDISEVLDRASVDFDATITNEIDRVPEPKPAPWLRNALTLSVVAICDPPIKSGLAPTGDFLSKVYASNKNLTGWPIWLDSRRFSDARARPHVVNRGWNTIIPFGSFSEDGLEVHRFEPIGRLFFSRALQDDLTDKRPRGSSLDPILMTYRVAEVVIVALDVFKAIGAKEDGSVNFRFHWHGLENRKLDAWANFSRYFSPRRSFTSEATSYIGVPLAISSLDTAPYVAQALSPLFSCFDGFEMPIGVIEELVEQLLNRRL
jgi:hypothetical protein